MKKYLPRATLAPMFTTAGATDSLIGITYSWLAQTGRLKYAA